MTLRLCRVGGVVRTVHCGLRFGEVGSSAQSLGCSGLRASDGRPFQSLALCEPAPLCSGLPDVLTDTVSPKVIKWDWSNPPCHLFL